MKKILPVAIISSMILISCQSGSSSTEKNAFDSSIVSTSNTMQTSVRPDSAIVAAPGQNISMPAGVNTISPVTTTPVLNQTVTAPTTTTTAATAPGMNPPHGQPGHKCEIAVGAPLNSAPAKTTATNTVQPVVTTTPTTAAPVKTAPGMNPPHGEPGHKCEIAVGAPLNSAPAKTPAKTDAAITPASAVGGKDSTKQ